MESGWAANRLSKRLFLGGVFEPVSAASLKAYLSKYGKVESCEVNIDAITGKSKGYGFVTFKSTEGAKKALSSQEHHVVDGIRIEIKPALTRRESVRKEAAISFRKLYVDHIPREVEKEELATFFARFGDVKEVVLMKHEHRTQAFAFVVFEDKNI